MPDNRLPVLLQRSGGTGLERRPCSSASAGEKHARGDEDGYEYALEEPSWDGSSNSFSETTRQPQPEKFAVPRTACAGLALLLTECCAPLTPPVERGGVKAPFELL